MHCGTYGNTKSRFMEFSAKIFFYIITSIMKNDFEPNNEDVFHTEMDFLWDYCYFLS